MTPLKIATVGAILKEADYRSTPNYMTAIKQEHVMAGHAWTTQLELAAWQFNTSTSRGIGPGKQSEPLSFQKLAAADLGASVKNPKYPVKVEYAVVIFTFFLLRELECACAQYNDMTIDIPGK